ncbi:Uma2 family endonuclease [Benzoatithermus flavus]|uniref:Uma2 family endonuclease n=1 Tax=Benzoatithermus flavus TaxID=3108223 RepID=A0ABU8XT95_9PROT
MEQPAPRGMTVAEFFAWDDGTDTRYELVHGAPVAMNPPLRRHVVITMNLVRALDARLRPPCRAYAGGGVARSDDDDEYRIPDVLVSCVGSGERTFDEPRLVAEVLSSSTEKEDRTAKLDFYRSLPSVEIILLIWQDARRVEAHTRHGEVWEVRSAIGSGAVPLESFDTSLPLDEIYAEV